MNQQNQQNYYVGRAAVSRKMAEQAANPAIATIHAELARRYEQLAAHPRRREGITATPVQAT